MKIIEKKDCKQLSDNIENKLVVINSDFFKSEFKDPKYQLVLAGGGFGCDASKMGNCVFVTECTSDSPESYRQERYNLIGEPTKEMIEEWQSEYGPFNEEVRNALEKEKIISFFEESVNKMKNKPSDLGIYYWKLDIKNNNQWAIVLGWNEGFDEEEKDDYMYGTWRICIKLAYQPVNSSMQCDYQTDWIMPYHDGEIEDCEISIYPNTDMKRVIDILLSLYKRIS